MASARVFTKNLANYMSLGSGALGAVLNGLGVFSVHAKIRFASLSGGINDNNIVTAIINGTTVGLAFSIDGTSSKLRVSARSVSTDSRQALTAASALFAGIDYSVGVIVDVTGDTLQLFLNGTSNAGPTGVTFANATWTLGTPTDNDAIGGFKAPPTATSDQFDGELSELAVWNIALSGANWTALAAGAAANTVASGNLLDYMTLNGYQSPETSTVGTLTGTITGSVPPITRLVLPPAIATWVAKAPTVILPNTFNPVWAGNVNQPGPDAKAL